MKELRIAVLLLLTAGFVVAFSNTAQPSKKRQLIPAQSIERTDLHNDLEERSQLRRVSRAYSRSVSVSASTTTSLIETTTTSETPSSLPPETTVQKKATVSPSTTEAPPTTESPTTTHTHPPTTISEDTGGWNTSEASWYGPGFYGNTTACGQRYSEHIQGVAHKTLKCGTQVTFRHNGREVTVPVIDRGPYTPGRTWDLSRATCLALDHCYTGAISWRLAS